MIYGKKVILFPTAEQEQLLFASCGVARFAYNRCKALTDRYYRMFGKTLPASYFIPYFTRLKQRKKYEWLKQYSADIPKQSRKDYYKAKEKSFKDFGNGYHIRFKSKYDQKQSFYADYIKTQVRKNKRVYISMIGEIKTSRQLPKNKKLSNPRVIFDGKHWYLSVGFEQADITYQLSDEVVGVDLGLKQLMTCSNGLVVDNINNTPKLKKLYRKKSIAQRKVSKRFVKGKKQSKGYYKAKRALRTILTKITNCNKNHIHQATTALAKTKPKMIVIETLTVKNMMKNKRLAPAFHKANLGFVKSCLTYKAKKYGIKLIQADRAFASSQICSCCGTKYNNDKQAKAWGLHIRDWTCHHCQSHHDRDINASLNLRNFGLRYRPLASATTTQP